MRITKEPHGATAYNTKRKEAWRNMMVAAINAGIEQQLFSLKSGDNQWPGYVADPNISQWPHVFSFTFQGGIPALASVGGYDELSINVVLWPNQKRVWRGTRTGGASAGDAFATGWLKRGPGAYLQTSPSGFCCRTIRVSSVADCSVQPKGFFDRGPIVPPRPG